MSIQKRTMPYVRLGNSGLKVSKIILGCMSYGDPQWQGWVLPEEEGIKHIKAAYDMGIQTFDTADVYSNGLSEIILGKAIKQHNLPREEIVVMTKLQFVAAKKPSESFLFNEAAEAAGYVNQYGLSRKHIFDAVQASLKRLQLDYIDVIQCHRLDPTTPIEETMHALNDIVKAGYVRYIGLSSCFAYQFSIMQNYALAHNLTPFISMQNHYNLAYREEEREMFPTLKHFGVGAIPWSPLARGYLTRPYESSRDTHRGKNDPMPAELYSQSEGNKQVNKRIEELAKKKGVSMAQISAAWIMNKDGVTAPIVGTTSLKNLEDLVAAVNVKLTDEEMKYLEEPYQPLPIFGHW